VSAPRIYFISLFVSFRVLRGFSCFRGFFTVGKLISIRVDPALHFCIQSKKGGIDFAVIFIKLNRLITGVQLKKLKQVPDERGYILEILRNDDPFFQKFGQVYLSVIYPNVIKGWHFHKVQTDHFAVIKGLAKIVLYDQRQDSSTYNLINEFCVGELNPQLIVIPPMILHGVKGIGAEPAYLINCPTETYNYDKPDEYRIDPYDKTIPYDWQKSVDPALLGLDAEMKGGVDG
jgi:dTDP-4-dehydrorhamnose 3,5-epimerase